MPQSAANSIAYSGAVQWSGKPQADLEQHLNQWYK
jgi:hypothetical protein